MQTASNGTVGATRACSPSPSTMSASAGRSENWSDNWAISCMGRDTPKPRRRIRHRILCGPRNPRRGPSGVHGLPGEFLVPFRALAYTGGRSAQYRQRQGRFFGKPPRKPESRRNATRPMIVGDGAANVVDPAVDPKSSWNPVDSGPAGSAQRMLVQRNGWLWRARAASFGSPLAVRSRTNSGGEYDGFP